MLPKKLSTLSMQKGSKKRIEVFYFITGAKQKKQKLFKISLYFEIKFCKFANENLHNLGILNI